MCSSCNLLPHQRLLKPREHSLPFVQKDQPESTWRSPKSQSMLGYCSIQQPPKRGINFPAFVITYGKHIPNPSFLYGRNSKKIVGNNSFLCSFPLIPQARIRVFGKSAVLIAYLIECAVEIDLSVFYKHSSRAPFVCNRCYKQVLCFLF